jgi:hypothetical protein
MRKRNECQLEPAANHEPRLVVSGVLRVLRCSVWQARARDLQCFGMDATTDRSQVVWWCVRRATTGNGQRAGGDARRAGAGGRAADTAAGQARATAQPLVAAVLSSFFFTGTCSDAARRQPAIFFASPSKAAGRPHRTQARLSALPPCTLSALESRECITRLPSQFRVQTNTPFF